MSVTPAIGESTSGGLISRCRILKSLISLIKKPHEILPHVAKATSESLSDFKLPQPCQAEAAGDNPQLLPIHDQLLSVFPSRSVQPQRCPLQSFRIGEQTSGAEGHRRQRIIGHSYVQIEIILQ